MILIKELTFNYGKKTALNNLNLSLSSGFNVLLGPNGAGKSTLFSLLTGLSQSSHGTIELNSLNIKGDKSQIMSQLGIVFQQSTLDLDLSVKQNLLYHGSLHGLSPAQTLANIESILSQLNLSDRLNDSIRSLNGGHRRRVEIARALIHQPKILLLDEATVGLDIDSRQLIIDHIRTLCQQRSICVLWATHLIDEIKSDDQLILLDLGRVVAQGNSGQLCRSHQVEDIYQLYRQLTNSRELL
ncbi:MAG: ATP-binding cassette domain-containing protein [Gammaproteobacteria bacterium]|nr:ATP-binding cassette domain-containing protein [Gammaproteobacteria bacterium]